MILGGWLTIPSNSSSVDESDSAALFCTLATLHVFLGKIRNASNHKSTPHNIPPALELPKFLKRVQEIHQFRLLTFLVTYTPHD